MTTAASAFLFKAYDFDTATSTLRLRYGFGDGDDDGTEFLETIVFPTPTRDFGANDRVALDQAFRLIFLLAGVSYYKARIPARLECPAFALDPVTAAFVAKVYLHGLGEFAYTNKLDLSDHISFVTQNSTPPQPQTLDTPHRACVPVGGGKDSIVTLEALGQAGEPITLFALSTPSGIAAPIKATIDVSGMPFVRVTRQLSPRLLELNKAGAFNGHVPITAILSAIAVATAIMQGFDSVVMSNEHSASAPNLRIGSREINHQYSKSFAFEQDFADYVRDHITPSVSYFSFLRPMSEVAITQQFARHERYFPVFRSCNTAFRQDDKRRNRNWCCDCPKCRFVFLALAVFVAKPKLIEIFGHDMLDDSGQTEGFAELCGLSAFKPFECVGEVEESALLLRKLAQDPAWQKDHVIETLAPKLPPASPSAFDDLFKLYSDHRVPEPYLSYLRGMSS